MEDESSNSESGKKTRKKRKPRVKSFLRQAAAIIASEQGMNAAAQQKLQNLAEYLKMPEEEFHEALSRLQETRKLPVGLNRYEKDFVAFLTQEFEQLKGGIMTVAMETKAVDLAARKYDILEPRARKLIHDHAEAKGVGRISRNDAETYVEQLIVSRIGDAKRIEEPTRERFYKIGEKWGVGSAEVDAIVLQAIGENRKLEQVATGTSAKSWVTIVLFLLLIGTGAVFTIFAKDWLRDRDVVDTEPKKVVAKDAELKPLQMPPWWHAHDMDRIVDDLLERGSSEGWIREMASSNVEQQSEGMSKLLALVAVRKGEELRDLQDFLANYFYACPEPMLPGKILNQVCEQLKLPESRVPVKTEKLQAIYSANRTLGHLKYFQPLKMQEDFAERQSRVESSIEDEFGQSPLGDDLITYMATTSRVIAINQWNHLIQTSWASPNRTSLLIQPLFDLTQTRLQRTELNRLHRRTVMSVLESDQALWFDLKPEISQAVLESPDNTINTWINHYQTMSDEGYQEWLGLELVSRCGLELPSQTMAEVAASLQKVKTGNRREQFRELLSRNEKVDKLVEELQNDFRTAGGSPQLIAGVARAVNLSMFLSPADQSSFSFDEFDLLYRRGSPNLATMARQSLKTMQVGKVGSATRSDRIQVQESLEQLESTDFKKQERRISSLKRLAEVAVRFDDLSYPDAEILANYYLDFPSDRERVQAEKLLPKFLHLPSFGLAVAENIAKGGTTLDDVLTIAQYYSEENYDLENPAKWRVEIRDFVFESVTRRLGRASELVTDRSQRWRFLREDYARLCRQRAGFLSSNGAPENAGSLESVRALILRIQTQLPMEYEYPVKRALAVLSEQSRPELVELVALNRLQVKLLAQRVVSRWPSRSQEAEAVVATLKPGVEMTTAELLLSCEFALLSLWNLERQAIAERLITR
jgi:hypothetical protein